MARRRRFHPRGMNAKVGQSKGTFGGRRYLKITSDSIRELVDLCHACFAIERSLGNRGIPCILIRGRKLTHSQRNFIRSFGQFSGQRNALIILSCG